jgi:hypothetical protein
MDFRLISVEVVGCADFVPVDLVATPLSYYRITYRLNYGPRH